MNKNNSKNNKRNFKGRVVSDKMDKTVVVAVDNIKMHSKYKKRFQTTKRFKAHDENNSFSVGDSVLIEEISPKSKEKKWRVVRKISSIK